MSVIAMPSMFHVLSSSLAPLAVYTDCWPDSAPPTFTRSTMMPGTVCRTTQGSRDDGMFCSSSRLTFVEIVWRLASITGVCAVTSTFSVTPPTVSITGSETIDPAPTGTLSFL
jgi:hypothetical protein